MQKKKRKKKTRQCCKTDKSCFFQLLLLLGGPFFYHVVDFPNFLKKSKSDFPFRPFFSQYVSVVKRFFTTPKYLKKAVHPKRESVVLLLLLASSLFILLRGVSLWVLYKKSSCRIWTNSKTEKKNQGFPFHYTGQGQFAIRSKMSLLWKMMHILLGVTRLQDQKPNKQRRQRRRRREMSIPSVISRFGFDKLVDTRPSIESKMATMVVVVCTCVTNRSKTIRYGF